MIADGEKRHYTAIKSLSMLLKSLNATHEGAYHFCMNCLNGFSTESARDKHYEYCSIHGKVKVKMFAEKDKWMQYHDGQCLFKVLIMLYADFESILVPKDERYKDKMNQLKSKRISHIKSYRRSIPMYCLAGVCIVNMHMVISLIQ